MIKTVNASPIIPAFKGAALSVVFSFVAIFISALLLTKSTALELLTAVLPKVTQVIAAFIGGFFAARASKERPYLSAALCGLIFSALIVIGSLICSGFKLYYAAVCLLSVTAASTVGSMLARNRGKSGAAKRRSIMKKIKR